MASGECKVHSRNLQKKIEKRPTLWDKNFPIDETFILDCTRRKRIYIVLEWNMSLSDEGNQAGVMAGCPVETMGYLRWSSWN